MEGRYSFSNTEWREVTLAPKDLISKILVVDYKAGDGDISHSKIIVQDMPYWFLVYLSRISPRLTLVLLDE